jgi:hypothetical protein
MSSGQSQLLHLPFFEALAGMRETSGDWRATSAGLVTLRLFDAWVEDGPRVVAPDAWGARSVREAIAQVDARSSVRALLTSAMDAMEVAPTVRVATVAPRLMAYARLLQFDARWALAADVYRTVIAHAHPMDDADVVITANLQLGACLRQMAEWTEASAAYATAGQIAAMTGDIVNVLNSRIAEANVALDHGNLPLAESIFDETIARAEERRLSETRGRAMHGRAHVAHLRRDFELAIRLAYEALEGLREPTARDRALADIATSFSELGIRSAARDANLLVIATAQDQYMRWVAMINLLELASLDRIEPVFEQYRRELAEAALPPTLRAYYFYYLGQGYRLFDKPDLACGALERAVEIATTNGLNQVLFQAEESLEAARRGGTVRVPETQQTAPETWAVARKIRGMRELAGVAR